MTDTYDFAAENVRLEVKATSARLRAHQFSFEQCHPPADATAILVSFLIDQSGGGTSLAELLTRVEARLTNQRSLIRRVRLTAASTLGGTLLDGLSFRFDQLGALASARYYMLNQVPAVRGEIDPDVSEIRFRSDLTRLQAVDPGVLLGSGTTLQAMLPEFDSRTR